MAIQMEPQLIPPASRAWPEPEVASLAMQLSRQVADPPVPGEQLGQGAPLAGLADLASQRLAILGEKAACLAHEVRNPLMAIGGFARRLADSPRLTDDERAKAALIAREARRLEQLLSTVLSFARPGQGQTAELISLVAECLELMRLGASGNVRYEARGIGPLAVPAQPDLVRQCLINLVKNATEATAGLPEGQGLVRVDVGREGRWALLRVSDNGAGMSQEQLARLFVPFSTTKAGGTGLGLTTTRRLVEDMGGSLTMQSTPGEGTVATLLLPVA